MTHTTCTPAPAWCTLCREHLPHPEGVHTGHTIARTSPDYLSVALIEQIAPRVGPEIEVKLAEHAPAYQLTPAECRALADALHIAASLADERMPDICPRCQAPATVTRWGICHTCLALALTPSTHL